MPLTEKGPLAGGVGASLASKAGSCALTILINWPSVMLVSALIGSEDHTGICVPRALSFRRPGMVLVNALAASVVRPSPSGPIAAPSRKCCQMGCVSQYIPPPPRITVLWSLPTAQANPTMGEKLKPFGCVAPSPYGTP